MCAGLTFTILQVRRIFESSSRGATAKQNQKDRSKIAQQPLRSVVPCRRVLRGGSACLETNKHYDFITMPRTFEIKTTRNQIPRRGPRVFLAGNSTARARAITCARHFVVALPLSTGGGGPHALPEASMRGHFSKAARLPAMCTCALTCNWHSVVALPHTTGGEGPHSLPAPFSVHRDLHE